MTFSASPTELTTGATDAVLGLQCLVGLWMLATIPVAATWKRALWCWVFGLLSFASLLGAVVHGLELSLPLHTMLWRPLNLSLGLTVALFFVGGVYDWRGEAAARALLPWAIGVGVAFFALTEFASGEFLLVVVYEAAALVAALAMYVFLFATRRLAGAGMLALGIALSIVAAALQTTSVEFRFIVPFDHNGVFHLIQMVAMVPLLLGVLRGLETRCA